MPYIAQSNRAVQSASQSVKENLPNVQKEGKGGGKSVLNNVKKTQDK